ncbi:MAG: cytochrome c biogenesis protein CcsA [Candidatus Heimdallarchaeota archaeon]
MFYINLGIFGMDLGVVLLFIGLIGLILDLFIVLLGENIERWEDYSEVSLIISGLSLITSFFYFGFSVITADYGFTYVSSFVNNSMDIFMRISAIWSGQAGSYFFWAFLAVVIYLITRLLFRQYSHETFFWRVFALMAFQVAILTLLTILSEPFRIEPIAKTDGIGLNPLLMNFWNFIHPPIIFVGYALCLIPMVIGIVRISILEKGKVPNFDGKDTVDKFFDFVVSLAWLVLGSGIIIGGYWAYITLGWGGFWAWDPVETASLIPWLFLTLYFHGISFHRKNEYLGNYIISMTYLGALFATYLTRSGILSSVHTFAPDGILESLLTIIVPSNSFIMAIILRVIPDERMLVLFVVILVTFIAVHFMGIKNEGVKQLPITLGKSDFQIKKARRTALKISYLALFFGTIVMVLGLITPVLVDILGYIVTLSPNGFEFTLSIGPPFFNTMLALFGGIMLLAQFFCTFYPRISVKRKFGLLVGGVTAGVLFAVSGILYRSGSLSSILGDGNLISAFFSNFWTTSDKANLVIPLIVLGMVGLFIEFIVVALKEEKQLMRKSSQTMLHLSFLVIILGAILSANMVIAHEITVQAGNDYEIAGTSLKISILDLDQRFPESGQNSVEYDTTFMIIAGTRVIGVAISQFALDRVDRQNPKVTIISDFLADIYVVTSGVFQNRITNRFDMSILQIRIIPYIGILWIGCLLLHFAVIPLTIKRFVDMKQVFSSSTAEKGRIEPEERIPTQMKT